MTEKHKCKECKWLTGERKGIGIECTQPEKKAKWDEKKTLWMGEFRRDTARYKQPNALACKKFEAKECEQ